MELDSDGIDQLLRSSMSAPIPTLRPDFDQHVMGAVRPDSSTFVHYRHMLLSAYGIVSVTVSAVLMRGQGLGWNTIAGLILGPLGAISIARAAWSRAKKTNPASAT